MTIGKFAFDRATRQESEKLIELALAEDLGSVHRPSQLDCTTESIVPSGVDGVARLVSREAGIVSGLEICQMVVDRTDRHLDLEIRLGDGDRVQPGETIAVLRGDARDILITERTCLNFLGRLSGIATLTGQYVARVDGTHARLFDTRKTTPGWRRLEKYAVRCGGGANHRMGLFDAILIKDNHLAMIARYLAGKNHHVSAAPPDSNTIPDVIERARAWIEKNKRRLPHGADTIVQIEVDRIDQLQLALAAQPDIVLLDNMSLPQLKSAVQIRDQMAPGVLLEASGGVTLETVGKIAQTGVERISVGALTHSAGNFDVGLDWELL